MAWMRGPLAGLAAALTAATAIAQQPATPLPPETPAPEQAAPVPPAIPPAAPSALVTPRIRGEESDGGGGLVAVINDEIVTNYDVRQRMLLLYTLSGIAPAQNNLQQFQQESLRSLFEERLQLQELRRVGADRRLPLIIDDAAVDREIAEISREASLTPEQFAQQLQLRGVSLAEMREYRRAQISWTSFVRAYFRTRVDVGQAQIDAALERLRLAQSRPQYQLSEIFIDPARVGGAQEAQFGATQLVAQLQQGAPFPAVARQFSAAATAARGGDAGWVSPADLTPEVAAAVEQMRPGQVSQPIVTPDGVYIISLRDRRTGAGNTVVRMEQAAIRLPADTPADQVAAARARLVALRPTITGCDTLETAVQGQAGVVAGDLGEVPISDLAEPFRVAAESLQPNQVSEPIQTNVGLHLVVLCARRQTAATLPSRTEIENRLRGEQYALYARRYLRDLQTSAVIESR